VPVSLARICRVSIVIAIAGVFGTWRSAGPVSLDGVEGPHDGWQVIIFALIALAGVGALARGSWLGMLTVFGGSLAMLSAAARAVVKDNAVLHGSSGWGVWLTIAASVVLGVCAIFAAVRRAAVAEPVAPPT
jgi:hypothetical protein